MMEVDPQNNGYFFKLIAFLLKHCINLEFCLIYYIQVALMKESKNLTWLIEGKCNWKKISSFLKWTLLDESLKC